MLTVDVRAAEAPGAGELLLATADRNPVAAALVDHGVEALLVGAAPIARIVIPVGGALDEWVAAAIARRKLEGTEVPASLTALARHAALGDAAPVGASSIEAVLLAAQALAGDDPRKLLAAWQALEPALVVAGDPLAPVPGFPGEHAFLDADRARFAVDAARAERAGRNLLLLHNPESKLWPLWARIDGAKLCAARLGENHWDIARGATAAAAEALQSAEIAVNATSAAADPWRFSRGRISAPRGGSALSRRRVLESLGVRPPRLRPAHAAAIPLIALIGWLAVYGLPFGSHPDEHRDAPATDAHAPETHHDADVKFRGGRALYSPPGLPKGKAVVVTIGINSYPNWQPLDNAVSDAEGLQRALVEKVGFTAPFEPLLQEKADRRSIEELLQNRLPKEVGENDSLVLFFAGHGLTQSLSRSEAGYIIPFDAAAASAERWSDYIRVEDVLRYADETKARHVLVILDSCFSGIALGQKVAKSRGDTKYLDPLAGQLSRRVITSARGNQTAQDSGGPLSLHSLFTGTLISGLATGDVDEDDNLRITSTELGTYLFKTVGAVAKGKQTPDYGAFGLDDRGEMVIEIQQDATP